MNILVVGLNHKTADVEVREKLAFNGPKLKEGLEGLRFIECIMEVVVLSTCNRVEIYANVKDPAIAQEEIMGFISGFHGIKKDLLENALYYLSGTDAVRHVFRVASSLDSMVLGEPQILGQLKDAFEFSLKNKATGVFINKLLKKAISVAKRVRTETRIAENAVSISFAAVELAKKIFSVLDGKTVMLLGAGEMAELAAKHLINSGVGHMLVANRTFETGCRLAEDMGGRAVMFESFLDEMINTDIVICSTGAPNYVVDKQKMHHVMSKRRNKPVFIIDISVPRNIDPAINDMENVFLYDVDDLQGVVDINVKGRKEEAEKAQAIIEEELESFGKWQSSLEAVPTIVALRQKAENIKNEELEKFINRNSELSSEVKQAVSNMAGSIVNKLVHPPTAALKQDAADRELLIATIKRLYGLNDTGDEDE